MSEVPQSCRLFATSWTVAYQAPPSKGFSRQECHFLLQGIFLTQEWNPGLPHCRQMLYRLSHQGSPHTSKVMLKILHARLQHYVNQEIPGVQDGFRKERGTRDQIANIHWIIEKAREFQKNIYLCFIDYIKSFVWIMTNWTALREMGISNHLICLLRNLYAGQETTV